MCQCMLHIPCKQNCRDAVFRKNSGEPESGANLAATFDFRLLQHLLLSWLQGTRTLPRSRFFAICYWENQVYVFCIANIVK